MKLKKLIGIITTFTILVSSLPVSAAFWDVSSDASYAKALEEVSSLGIIQGNGDGSFSPDENVTREQFAAMIVKAAGLKKKAQDLSGSSIFIDVDPYSWSTGYINAAVSKGYITGMSDNRFYPQNNITFAEACTILVKALNYTDSDLTGTWPKNYIEKAKTLGVASGINLGTSDSLPRWAAAQMIDNLLDTDVKTASSANSSTTVKTFAEFTGVYVDSFIFANSTTNSKLLDNQIQTDKGIYYYTSDMNLQVGGKYRFTTDSENTDKILYAYNKKANVKNISVDSILDNKVTYKEDGQIKTIILPDKTVYYYGGAKTDYDKIKSAIQAKSSIVMIYNDDNSGFEYGLVFDPVTSKPFVLQDDGADANIPAEFDIRNTTIIANGKDDNNESIDGKIMQSIELRAHDVLYNVCDIWGQNRHILLVRNSVKGKIDSILPDKISPTSVTINATKYELSSDFNSTKLNTTSGSFTLDDEVILVMGKDGKAVDMFYRDYGDNKNYAIVLDSSVSFSDEKGDASTIIYKVTLLHTDGTTSTYNINHNAKDYKGKLVKFEKEDETHVVIEDENVIDYMDYPGDHTFSFDNRTLDGEYIADNVIIFNLQSNVDGSAAKAEILDLDEIPGGKYYPNKLLYEKKEGPFNDITLIVTNDIFDGNYSQAVVVDKSEPGNLNTTYKLMIGSNTYSYSGLNIPSADTGSIFKVNVNNGTIDKVIDYLIADVEEEAVKVQSIDSKRIKINNHIYWFKDNANIYLKDAIGTLKKINTEDVDLAAKYVSIRIYYDKDVNYGGKVATVVLTY